MDREAEMIVMQPSLRMPRATSAGRSTEEPALEPLRGMMLLTTVTWEFCSPELTNTDTHTNRQTYRHTPHTNTQHTHRHTDIHTLHI